MFGGVLNKLLAGGADDVVRASAKKLGSTAAKQTSAAAPEKSLIQAANKYLDKPGITDRYGFNYMESDVPVASLSRRSDFQPRTTASGKGTEKSVFEHGYREGAVDQPMLVRKTGDKYEVLGGHSRTLGMEKRTAAGLSNPEAVKARVYDGISDAEAKQIARAANQGGQYESTIDMAKSISDSISEGLSPSVQKQNMAKGYGYDDYQYLWNTVSGDNILMNKVFHGAVAQDDILSISRHARQKGLEPDKTMGIISSLDRNGTLTRSNAKNVVSLLTGKIKAGIQKDAQTGLFGDIETAVNAVDLLKDFTTTSGELSRRMNAIKVTSAEAGLSDAAMKELTTAKDAIQKKMNNISDEILARYGRQTAAEKAAVADVSSEATETMGFFSDPTPAAPVKQKTVTESNAAKQPKKINVLKINDHSTSGGVHVQNNRTPAPQPTRAQPATHRKAVLTMKALERTLPDPKVVRAMSDETLAKAIPGWKSTLASITAIQAALDRDD